MSAYYQLVLANIGALLTTNLTIFKLHFKSLIKDISLLVVLILQPQDAMNVSPISDATAIYLTIIGKTHSTEQCTTH